MKKTRDFPGCRVVGTLCSCCGGHRLDPWWGTGIPCTVRHGQKIKTEHHEWSLWWCKLSACWRYSVSVSVVIFNCCFARYCQWGNKVSICFLTTACESITVSKYSKKKRREFVLECEALSLSLSPHISIRSSLYLYLSRYLSVYVCMYLVIFCWFSYFIFWCCFYSDKYVATLNCNIFEANE